MDEKNKLIKKYQSIDAVDNNDKKEKKAEEKKIKEPKPPKEKKVKEPKPPKEKKVKEPKPPKEKKVKEPKPPKEKKVKEPKPPKEEKVKEPKPPKEKKVKEPKPPKEEKVKEPKPPKEKKVKEPKPPKEKKVKEPKPPKEKKVKEPKPPKEKKVKEPKPPKEKKVKEPKPPKEKKLFGKNKKSESSESFAISEKLFEKEEKENTVTEFEDLSSVTPSEAADGTDRLKEEFVLPVITKIEKVSETNPDKKKIKLPKIKIPKISKDSSSENGEAAAPKKEKSEKPKKEKRPKVKQPREPLGIMDFVTIGTAVLAVLLIAGYFGFRHWDKKENPEQPTKPPVELVDKMDAVQVSRDNGPVSLVQSDIPNVFYGFSPDHQLYFYQYRLFENRMVPVDMEHEAVKKLDISVDMGNQNLPVTIQYVELGGDIFGIGLFRADDTPDIYFYSTVSFKLTNLPEAYRQDGKALLLAKCSDSALKSDDPLWSESFVLDLNTGKTERFLSVINRTSDIETGNFVDDFCIMTKESYNTTASFVPFISSREYPTDVEKQDIFIKDGSKERLIAEDIYGKFFLSEGNSVIFMRETDTGFNLVRKTGTPDELELSGTTQGANGETVRTSAAEEEILREFYGFMNSEYIRSGDWLLGKNDGKLYNLRTGEVKTLVGYRMAADDKLMLRVSPDGKYAVMMGTVQSAVDYQIHIFNLETGAYSKYIDKNFSPHTNLAFIDDSTAIYSVLDPRQAFEYVAFNVRLAK